MFYTENTCYTTITQDDFNILTRGGYPVIFMSDTLPVFARGSKAKLISEEIPAPDH